MNSKTVAIILALLLIVAVVLAVVLCSKNRTLTAEVDRLTSSEALLKSENDEFKSKLRDVEAKLDAAPRKEDVAQLEKKVADLESELKEAQSDDTAAKLREELKKARDELGWLRQKLEEKSAELTTLNGLDGDDLAKELQRKLSAARLEIERLEAAARQNRSSDSTGAPAPATAPETKTQTSPAPAPTGQVGDDAACREELASVRTDADRLREQLTGMKAEIDRLQALAAELEGDDQKNEAKLKDLQQSLTRMRDEMASVQKEKERAEAELESLKITHEGLVRDLKQQIDNKEVAIKQMRELLTVSLVDSILFKSGSAHISPEGKKTLGIVAESLGKVANRRIRVVGYTDDQRIAKAWQRHYATNWDLSAARAVAVTRFLTEQAGLDPAVFEAAGRSFNNPVADNETEEGRARNRRVEIVIAPVR